MRERRVSKKASHKFLYWYVVPSWSSHVYRLQIRNTFVAGQPTSVSLPEMSWGKSQVRWKTARLHGL